MDKIGHAQSYLKLGPNSEVTAKDYEKFTDFPFTYVVTTDSGSVSLTFPEAKRLLKFLDFHLGDLT